MNFQEFIDKLPPEDRQFVINHFVRNILGQEPKEEVIIRRTAKFSTLGTEEEMIEEIAKTFNIPIEQIRNQNVAQKLKAVTQGYHQTSLIIDQYKNFLTKKGATKDKFEELYDVGKFLVSLNIQSTLEIPDNTSAIPDFIISSDNKRIGIEHTRLINTISQIWIKTVSQILKKAETLLLKRNPELKQIVNISINYWKLGVNGKNLSFKLSIHEKEKIANEVADYIESLLTNRGMTQPSFIDKISISEKSEHPLNLILNENYIAKTESTNLFVERIRDKESKLCSYLANNSLDELWLLIVISDVTGSSSFILQKQNHFETKFDKVFLFDNFSNEYLICKS
ncbi:MAG: hypothetical protein ACTHOB_18055 [Ginsengibacter sp.]